MPLIRFAVRALLWIAFLAGAGVTLIGFLAPWKPLADFANHIRPAAFAGFVVLAAAVGFAKDRALRAVTFAGLAINLALFSIPFFTAAKSAGSSAAAGTRTVPLDIVSFNLLWDGRRLDEVAAYLQKAEPDIVLLQEADLRNRRALFPLLEKAYPHIVTCEREPCDVAILSKLPVRGSGSLVVPGRLPHLVWATIDKGSGITFRIGSVHTAWPGRAAAQAEQIQSIEAWRNTVAGPIILGGDFNLTPWSWLLQRLQWTTGLVRHATLLRSWPASNSTSHIPLPAFLIDHILTTPGIETLSIDTGPNLGSDHLPIVARLALPPG